MLEEMAANMEEIVMDRYTQFKANFPPIKQPRFYDKTLLINAQVGTYNKVVCTYIKADGDRLFPEPLYISGHEAKKYKPFAMKTMAGGKIMVRAIPIDKFKRLKISEHSLYEV
jgi:hypothetical protein